MKLPDLDGFAWGMIAFSGITTIVVLALIAHLYFSPTFTLYKAQWDCVHTEPRLVTHVVGKTVLSRWQDVCMEYRRH